MKTPCSAGFVKGINRLFFALIMAVTMVPAVPASAQDASATKRALRSVADAVLAGGSCRFVDTKSGKRYSLPEGAPPKSSLRPENPYSDWRYWNGVVNISLLRLADELKEPAYSDFVNRNIAFAFDNVEYFKGAYKGEGKWEYPFGQFFLMEELDDCGAMGAAVLEIQRRSPQPRYAAYIERAADHMLVRQPRIDDGTLVRSFPQKWTLWADDLYMSVVFLARMGEMSGDRRFFDDAARQVINFHKHLFDEPGGLMYHYWYSEGNRAGVAFWGRANGWALLAQVDLLDRIPADHPERSHLLELLRRHIFGIARYQGGEGLWHQLIDKTDSFFETSCSAMITYAVARAVNRGYIEPRYAAIARQGWKGVLSKIHSDGQIEGICAGTGIGDDLVHYYSRPAPLNDPHGTGAVLLAGAEILRLRE